MLTGRVCPLMCGSAINHIGTAELLRRIITYMPDASQKVMMGTDKKTGEPVLVYPNKPFTAFVFKTLIDPFAGKLIMSAFSRANSRKGTSYTICPRIKKKRWAKS